LCIYVRSEQIDKENNNKTYKQKEKTKKKKKNEEEEDEQEDEKDFLPKVISVIGGNAKMRMLLLCQ
jgi:hypothetical protein